MSVALQRRFRPTEPGGRVKINLGVDEATLAAVRAAAGESATLSAALNDVLRRGVERIRAEGLPRAEDRPAKRVRWQPDGDITWTTVSTDQETADLVRDLAHRWHTTGNGAIHRLLAKALGRE